jgi:hypothetical protein
LFAARGERWPEVTALHQPYDVRIDAAPDPDRPDTASICGHTPRDLRIAAANQLALWAAGQECDDFRREYLTELVVDLRAAAIDVAADQLDLWRAGKACDEQRRVSVLALVAELRAQS